MWVEVVGLPGVGKTTFVQRNLPAIRRRFDVVTSWDPPWTNWPEKKLRYALWYRWAVEDRDLARKVAYRASFRPLRRSRDVFFFDSGIVQSVLENLIATRFDDVPGKTALLTGRCLPDVAIYLRDDPEEAARRELARADRHGFTDDTDEQTKLFAEAREVLEDDILPRIDRVVPAAPGDDFDAVWDGWHARDGRHEGGGQSRDRGGTRR